jgi:hypothetical protein
MQWKLGTIIRWGEKTGWITPKLFANKGDDEIPFLLSCFPSVWGKFILESSYMRQAIAVFVAFVRRP